MANKNKIREISLRRIKQLFELSFKVLAERPDLSQRYVEIARKISMRTRTRLPRENRLLICRHCKKFIFPGVSSRIRIQPKREPHIVITCLYCGKHMRIPLKRRRR
jgi:ribonuclease P protein subunit RPR2